MNKKKIIIIVVSVAVIVSLFFIFKHKKAVYSFDTVEIVKGDVSKEITASGTLEALNTVDVGTQVSGIISKIYVDYNDHVKKGQVIAELDKITLEANVMDAEANFARCQVQVEKTKKDWERNKVLLEQRSVSQVDYDVSWFDYQTALGNQKSAEANLKKARINLNYATIISPVDGVVLSRKIDEGQTVAASFNTPTLFSIAKDLTKMRVLANIDEADIGQVQVGQFVSFTVDAYTDLKFSGVVKQIRLEPTTTQNVVTYTVVVEVPNDDFKLMPGMTANLSIVVNQKKDVLHVTQPAIRFNLDEKLIASTQMKIAKGNNFLKDSLQKNHLVAGAKLVVWKLKKDSIIPVQIILGITDGSNWEITGDIQSGDKLITEVKQGAAVEPKKNSTNPFMPQFPKKK